MQISSLYKIVLETKVVLHPWHFSKWHTVFYIIIQKEYRNYNIVVTTDKHCIEKNYNLKLLKTDWWCFKFDKRQTVLCFLSLISFAKYSLFKVSNRNLIKHVECPWFKWMWILQFVTSDWISINNGFDKFSTYPDPWLYYYSELWKNLQASSVQHFYHLFLSLTWPKRI